jgi:predicted Fe-S protein YdhL (DUF1289 family)
MTAAEQLPSVQSPCSRICTVDPATRMCVGCGRTLAEIECWLRYSDAERARIMSELPQRLAGLGLPNQDKPG